MLYVGFLETPYRMTKYGMLALIIGIFFALVMVLAAWLSVRWARSIFQPVERMHQTMQCKSKTANTPPVAVEVSAQDELGCAGQAPDLLLDLVDDKTSTLQRWGNANNILTTGHNLFVALSPKRIIPCYTLPVPDIVLIGKLKSLPRSARATTACRTPSSSESARKRVRSVSSMRRRSGPCWRTNARLNRTCRLPTCGSPAGDGATRSAAS